MIEGQENFKGNEEHLKKLLEAIQKKDILLWNNFVETKRKQNEYFKPELSGANLWKTDLRKVNLKGAYLSEANLSDYYRNTYKSKKIFWLFTLFSIISNSYLATELN